MRLLLSIKPAYSQRIFSGEKKFEFRKTKPKSAIDFVVVYESSPSRNIVGGFTIKKILSGNPDDIWEKCKHFSGIEQSRYKEYCGKANLIHAFEIDQTYKLKKPLSPLKLFSDFKPPQSYCYLKASLLSPIGETTKNIQKNVIQNSNVDASDERFLDQLHW